MVTKTPTLPPELVVFSGLQASGKTTYYRSHLSATHLHVSKDLMTNTRDRDARQLREIGRALAEGKSVVVDNTNAPPAVRAPLIVLGRAYGARVVAYYFETTVKDSVARKRLRERKAHVPYVALFVTAKKMVPPTLAEGFDEVRVIPPL